MLTGIRLDRHKPESVAGGLSLADGTPDGVLANTSTTRVLVRYQRLHIERVWTAEDDYAVPVE